MSEITSVSPQNVRPLFRKILFTRTISEIEVRLIPSPGQLGYPGNHRDTPSLHGNLPVSSDWRVSFLLLCRILQ